MDTGFLVAWTPYAGMALGVLISGVHPGPGIATAAAVLAKSATAFNPLIYAAADAAFRCVALCPVSPLRVPHCQASRPETLQQASKSRRRVVRHVHVSHTFQSLGASSRPSLTFFAAAYHLSHDRVHD